MNIKFHRHVYGKDSTGSICTINGSFFCYSLEDEYRAVKVMHETCIPAGRYRLLIRDAGGLNERYKARYPFHKGMLHLQDVDGFEWIYIHVGNTDDHTSGCLLIAQGILTDPDNESTLQQSAVAYERLYGLIMLALENGEEIYVEVS